MRLSEAIRRGCTMSAEVRDGFVNSCGTCAMGAAWLALGHSHEERYKYNVDEAFAIIAAECGLPVSVVTAASREHQYSNLSREQIADWVEREYESKLPQKERETDEAYARRMVAQIVSGQHQHTLDELNA